MRAARKNEVLGAAWLVGVAGNLDWTIVGCGLAPNETLRVESARTTVAVGHALGNAAPVCIDKPGQVEHLPKRTGAKIKIEAGNKHIVIVGEQILCEL